MRHPAARIPMFLAKPRRVGRRDRGPAMRAYAQARTGRPDGGGRARPSGRRWHRFRFHGTAVVPPRCRRHAASVPPFVGSIWTNAPLVLFARLVFTSRRGYQCRRHHGCICSHSAWAGRGFGVSQRPTPRFKPGVGRASARAGPAPARGGDERVSVLPTPLPPGGSWHGLPAAC